MERQHDIERAQGRGGVGASLAAGAARPGWLGGAGATGPPGALPGRAAASRPGAALDHQMVVVAGAEVGGAGQVRQR